VLDPNLSPPGEEFLCVYDRLSLNRRNPVGDSLRWL